jgi:hypothetical protein
MRKAVLQFCLRGLIAVCVIYTGLELTRYFDSGFEAVTKLESLNRSSVWTARYLISGASETEVRSAYDEIQNDLKNLKVNEVSCCVPFQGEEKNHGDAGHTMAGIFEILIVPADAFALDTLYNDIHYLFSHLSAAYPALEVSWSGVISFSQDFFSPLLEICKKHTFSNRISFDSGRGIFLSFLW